MAGGQGPRGACAGGGAAASAGARPLARRLDGPEQARLAQFAETAIGACAAARDRPALDACSGLSENLACGEISPRQCWQARLRARQAGADGAEAWLRELAWREFACHLLHHTPRIATRNWRPEWDGFPWNEDDTGPAVIARQRGRTGVPFVDAAMREMYVTGRMHNRARMIVASFLTKHLLTRWRVGLRWFADCLTDWDPAGNAPGWQWVAGCGPDAAPCFRIFNPATQARKFDPDGTCRRRWIAEGQAHPPQTALDCSEAVPRGWGLSPAGACPVPVVALDAGRRRALAACAARGTSGR